MCSANSNNNRRPYVSNNNKSSSRALDSSSKNKSRMRSVYSNSNRTPNGYSDNNRSNSRMRLLRPQHSLRRLPRSLSPRQPSDRNALSEGNSSLQTRTTRNPTIEKRSHGSPYSAAGSDGAHG